MLNRIKWKSELEISVRFSPALKVVLLAKSYAPIRTGNKSTWAAQQAYKVGKFHSLLRQHKREKRENFFASLDLHNTDPGNFFRTIRQKNGHQTVPTTQLVSRGKTHEGPEVMDSWKRHHSATGEVARAIESLASNKAPAPDEVEAEHLHFGGPSLIIHLTNTFNAIVATGHIPAPFLHGHIIPIPKGHDRDLRDPSNYRGIYLLSSISKVLERVLINIISPSISLNPLQGGFRSGYTAVFTLPTFYKRPSSTQGNKTRNIHCLSRCQESLWYCVAWRSLC